MAAVRGRESAVVVKKSQASKVYFCVLLGHRLLQGFQKRREQADKEIISLGSLEMKRKGNSGEFAQCGVQCKLRRSTSGRKDVL